MDRRPRPKQTYYKVWDLDRQQWWKRTGSRRLSDIWTHPTFAKKSIQNEAYYNPHSVPVRYEIIEFELKEKENGEIVYSES